MKLLKWAGSILQGLFSGFVVCMLMVVLLSISGFVTHFVWSVFKYGWDLL